MRRANVTETPHFIITDKRANTSQPNPNPKKLTIEKVNNTELRLKPNNELRSKQTFTNFVSNYSRIYGVNYKEALQSQEVKNLYKSFNRPQEIGNEFFVKNSFEEKRPTTYTPQLRKAGETIFIDPRQNESTFEPTNIKEISNDQQRLQISRGLYVDLKRSYLEYVNRDMAYKNFFRKSGHTQENFKPITDSLTIGIFENAIQNRIQNIYSISPFLEVSILNNSFSKYKTQLTRQNRIIYERPISLESPSIITKLGSSRAVSKNIKNSDTFFCNTSSFFYGADLISEIILRKISENQKNYDVIFTDSNKQMSTISDFFNNSIGEDVVDKLVVGSTSEKEEVLKVLRDKNNGNFILQETTNQFLENISNSLKNYAGDSRALLEKITQNMTDKSTVYYNMEPATSLQRGDLFKTNPTSKKIYLYSRQEEIDPDNVNLFYINEKRSERQLQNRNTTGFKKSALRKVAIIPENMVTASSQEIGFNKLAETLPQEKLSDIFMVISGQDEKLSKLLQKKKKVMKEEGDDGEGEDVPDSQDPNSSNPPVQGEGVLGGNISSLLNEFKTNFNPIFKYLGKSGIEHLYKLSF